MTSLGSKPLKKKGVSKSNNTAVKKKKSEFVVSDAELPVDMETHFTDELSYLSKLCNCSDSEKILIDEDKAERCIIYLTNLKPSQLRETCSGIKLRQVVNKFAQDPMLSQVSEIGKKVLQQLKDNVIKEFFGEQQELDPVKDRTLSVNCTQEIKKEVTKSMKPEDTDTKIELDAQSEAKQYRESRESTEAKDLSSELMKIQKEVAPHDEEEKQQSEIRIQQEEDTKNEQNANIDKKIKCEETDELLKGLTQENKRLVVTVRQEMAKLIQYVNLDGITVIEGWVE